jgi:pectate lyase
VLLRDDFEAFDSTVWTPSMGSSWAISTDGTAVYGQTDTESDDPHVTAAGQTTWTDVDFDVDMKVLDFPNSSSSYLAGVCVRVSGAGDFYVVGLRSNDQRIGIRRFVDGDGNNIGDSDEQDLVAENVWFNLRVVVQGATISAFFNGVLAVTIDDTTHVAGGVGLCTVKSSAVYDDVLVKAPE